jgi:RNA polymerase sigma-70 factor, ECF subfamily
MVIGVVPSSPDEGGAAGVAALPETRNDHADLVASLRQGRLDALACAFDRWHQRVRVLARRLLSDAAAAEDVVQEVFAALPRAIQRFRGETDLETFLLAIAVKRARHNQRAAARRRRALARLATEERRGPRDPEQDAYRRQLGLRLGAALDRLPLAQRVAFVLCEVEELTSAQAAAIAAVPEATVRTRLFHARRRLRALLDRERDG